MDKDTTPVEQNRNIIQEMQDLNQLTGDINNKTFKKTTYWHEQGGGKNADIIESLQRIEDRLTKIEVLLDEMI